MLVHCELNKLDSPSVHVNVDEPNWMTLCHETGSLTVKLNLHSLVIQQLPSSPMSAHDCHCYADVFRSVTCEEDGPHAANPGLSFGKSMLCGALVPAGMHLLIEDGPALEALCPADMA